MGCFLNFMKLPEIDRLSFRIEDMELRTVNELLLRKEGNHCTAEIVKWAPFTTSKKEDTQDPEEFCHTLAYWKLDRQGFQLRFCHDLPFYNDEKRFWFLGKIGSKYLLDYYNNNYEEIVEELNRIKESELKS